MRPPTRMKSRTRPKNEEVGLGARIKSNSIRFGIRWVLNEVTGVEAPALAKKTIDLEGRVVKDVVRSGRYCRTSSEEELCRIYNIPIPPLLDLPVSYNI